MCHKPHLTRRYCMKCKTVTSWKIDPAINHSRCLICHSDSSYSRKNKKLPQKEKKMNKQYVKEQIEAAIAALREEYDAKIGNIYQCPDCGAVAFRDSEHICFKGQIQPTIAPNVTKKPTIREYIMAILPRSPPTDGIIDANSAYVSQGIVSAAIDSGYAGSKGAIGACLSEMAKKKLINRRAAIIRMTSTSKSNRTYEKEVSGFVYWAGNSC